MTDVDVLMIDGCTRKEAERHLERGTTVFKDFVENFDKYMNEWNVEEDEKEMYRKMILERKPCPDWGVVEDIDGNVYFIQYCL